MPFADLLSKLSVSSGPTLNITAKKIECEHSEIEQVMLPLLRGRVFHVTKEENFEDIRRSGWIVSNQQARLAFTPRQAESSYGCKRGWVSLYDLSDPTDGEIKEVIVATNFTNEGEATAHYISEMLKGRNLRVTRIARGVPVGGELEYVDTGTLAQAFAERRPL